MQKLGYKKSFCPKMVFNRIGQKKERKVNGGNGILWHVPKPLMVILHLYWKKKQRVERKEAVFVVVVGKKNRLKNILFEVMFFERKKISQVTNEGKRKIPSFLHAT